MSYLVIKCGGSIIDDLPDSFFKNLVDVQKRKRIKPIIVHGGGPMITTKLKQMKVPTSFVDGLRVTTKEVLDVVEMVLSGSVNKKIVRKLLDQKAKAIGISGVDDRLLEATPIEEVAKYGYVGQVEAVNTELIEQLIDQDYLPVISPIALGHDRQRYNINADRAASAIASALNAPLCFVSDIPGVCVDGEVLHFADQAKINQLIDEGTIYGGMIPKVASALDALQSGVPEVSIVSGIEEHALLNILNNQRVGTRIVLRGGQLCLVE